MHNLLLNFIVLLIYTHIPAWPLRTSSEAILQVSPYAEEKACYQQWCPHLYSNVFREVYAPPAPGRYLFQPNPKPHWNSGGHMAQTASDSALEAAGDLLRLKGYISSYPERSPSLIHSIPAIKPNVMPDWLEWGVRIQQRPALLIPAHPRPDPAPISYTAGP